MKIKIWKIMKMETPWDTSSPEMQEKILFWK